MNNECKYILNGYETFLTNKHEKCPKSKPYIAQDELVEAVNLAICLNRPLLLEGEAGCGKTLLAYDVAYKLGLPLYPWPVRSTSKAQDGLYSYDAILRLHDVQVAKMLQTNTNFPFNRDPQEPKTYRKFGPLGEAFTLEQCPGVVLIDEIDKADIDFPNDLLSVLDDFEFKIDETGETISPKHKPIIIITSNKEKGNLPAPFLRRCIYYFIEFPKKDFLQQIVDEHYQNKLKNFSNEQKTAFSELSNTAINKFFDLRETWGLHKKPGTSEFLDWLKILQSFSSTPYNSKQLQSHVTIPYPELLLKLRADWLINQNKQPK